MILPPSIFSEFPCPCCGRSGCWTDHEHSPEVFAQYLIAHLDGPPIPALFVCRHCRVVLTPADFAEKAAEARQVDLQNHRAWRRVNAMFAAKPAGVV